MGLHNLSPLKATAIALTWMLNRQEQTALLSIKAEAAEFRFHRSNRETGCHLRAAFRSTGNEPASVITEDLSVLADVIGHNPKVPAAIDCKVVGIVKETSSASSDEIVPGNILALVY